MRVRSVLTRGVIAAVAASAVVTGMAGASAEPAPSEPVQAQRSAGGATPVTTERIAGANRYETSAKIVKRAFPYSFTYASAVNIARGDVTADALAAGAMSYPTMLVPRCGEVPDAVRTTIRQLQPGHVIALGGTSSVCTSLLKKAAQGTHDYRLAGKDRYATSLEIAGHNFWEDARVPTVYVASGLDGVPDAVAGGALTDGPILTINPRGGSSVLAARRWVAGRRVGRVIALGGTSTVPDAVLKRIAGSLPTSRLAGADRYATSVAIGHRAFKGTAPVAYLARGDKFADAVAAGAFRDGPVYLTGSCDLPSSVARAITTLRPRRVVALGGESAVCDTVLRQAAAAVGGNAVPPSVPTQIAAGGGTSCAIASGAPYCWGQNSNGQLGTGDRLVHSRPVPVRGLSTATSIAPGAWHTCAVSEGDAYCWGKNDEGQLGTTDQKQASLPQRVAPLANVTGISAGVSHTCAISKGAVYCWGANEHGQLGTGASTGSSTPRKVVGLTNVQEVSAGTWHTCAIAEGGTYCWGRNTDGQLGNGTKKDSSRPVKISGSLKVTSISSGGDHTCAVAGQRAYCWGENHDGELGTGNFQGTTKPARVARLDRISAISAGGRHSCAVNGTRAYCWGYNDEGALGDGSGREKVPNPVRVGNLENVTLVSAEQASCAIAAGSAYCWGPNWAGLGTGGPGSARTPQRVAEFPNPEAGG